MPASLLHLAGASIELSFARSECGPILAAVQNRLSGRRIVFDPHAGLDVSLGDGADHVRQRHCRLEREELDEEAGVLKIRLRHDDTGLSIWLEIAVRGAVAQMRARIQNAGTTALRVRDVTFLDARASEPVRQGESTMDLSRGDAGDAESGVMSGAFDANPLFFGDDVFLGVDWPVAQNACRGNAITCRQFPGRTLAPGEEWLSRTFSIGGAAPGGVAHAFLAHLETLRGRPPRRASFYFDWLLHASEGPTEDEVAATLAFFRLLRDEHGVQFDIYALDDGAVETRWGLMWDRYRLQHDRLFPHGLERLADEAKAIGMRLGVWLGPDVVYEGDPQDSRRASDIQWMIRTWGIALIKLDVCVSWPLTDDPYHNDWYLTRLAELYDACRAINPGLVVINHRIRFSPYMLAVLDSTLWEGAESYPEVFLVNGNTPRLRTRFAAYARRAPTYYGEYSPLLEDHGVCFNGDWRGWREEFVLGVFGRALALSPEVYGTLFGLPDEEYPELGRLMQLARAHRDLLAHTVFVPEHGDFLHTDGKRALRCLVNDGWQTLTRTLHLDRDFDLLCPDGGLCRVSVPFPSTTYRALEGVYAPSEVLEVPLLPFGVALIGVELVGDERGSLGIGHGDPPVLPMTQHLATLTVLPAEEAAGVRIAVALEATRFAASSDTPEMQALSAVAPSRYREVDACRAYYRQKQRRESTGIAANAWDGDPLTAWADEGFATHTSNVWRLDLGGQHPVGRVEVTLSRQQPAAAHQPGVVQPWPAEPVIVEASADLLSWHAAPAHVFYRRTPLGTSYPHAFIAEFGGGPEARYIRILARGFSAQDITVRTPVASPLSRESWHGNNTLTARRPIAVLSGRVTMPDVGEGHVLAVICLLGEGVSIDPNIEVALAWVTQGERVIPLVDASPLLPSHRWECFGLVPGNHVVFRLPLAGDMTRDELAVTVALFSPQLVREGRVTTYLPEVRVLCVPEAAG